MLFLSKKNDIFLGNLLKVPSLARSVLKPLKVPSNLFGFFLSGFTS